MTRRRLPSRPRLAMPALLAWLACGLSVGPAHADPLGDAQAALQHGLLYDLGHGVPENAAQAFACYYEAALAGLAEAQFNVAVMYDSGRGVRPDPAQAAQWYGSAAAQGQPRAAYNLGQLYAAGDGVPANADIARAWFEAAARAGITAASARIATLQPSGRPAAAASALASPVPAVPQPGAVLARPTGQATVELVWNAPAQPVAVRFFVEVARMPAEGAPAGGATTRVFASYADLSAQQVGLEAPGQYAWRVSAVALDTPHYRASAWTPFTVQSGPSVASEICHE